jgi:hypothetical protein
LISVFPAHHPADGASAHELAAFLEAGCDALCPLSDAAMRPGEDLLDAAERGLSADVLVLLISAASNLPDWPRDRWKSILLTGAAEAGTRVVVFLKEECVIPAGLRRPPKFFDATRTPVAALRRLKRWIKGIRVGTEPAMIFSPDLEDLYACLADQPGRTTASEALASRFAREAARDFEAVVRIRTHGRTLARIAGDLGAQLEMTLDGPVKDNCRRIREVLAARRCLLILDAPSPVCDPLLPDGHTSVLFVNDADPAPALPPTLADARKFLAARRYAEAYELLYLLLDAVVETETCARELVWICEHWDRYEEARALRSHIAPAPGEQLTLF